MWTQHILLQRVNFGKNETKQFAQKYEKLNNDTLPKVAHDKEARIGCKGKNKFWYGYKKHVSVDMQSGCVNKVAITSHAKGFKHVCPLQGEAFVKDIVWAKH